MRMAMKKIWIARAARFVAFAVLGVGLFGFGLMGLWNVLVPAMFGGPVITFWQALGLFALSRILFFPFRLRGRPRRQDEPRGAYFRKRFEEKLSRMTPEERERFRNQYAGRCGNRWSCTPAEEVRVPVEEQTDA